MQALENFGSWLLWHASNLQLPLKHACSYFETGRNAIQKQLKACVFVVSYLANVKLIYVNGLQALGMFVCSRRSVKQGICPSLPKMGFHSSPHSLEFPTH